MKLATAFVFIFVTLVYGVFTVYVLPSGGLPAFASLSSDVRGQIGDAYGLLNGLFSSLGFAGVLITLMLQSKDLSTQAKNNDDEVAERRSLFNLEASIDAHSKALGLLADGNNDRATWIRAARILRHGQFLADAVTVAEHKLALELRLLDYRSGFRSVLEHKPAEFYYGIDPKFYGVGLDRIARMSSEPNANEPGHAITATRWLAEQSILAVLEASQWPKDYQDPLDVDVPSAPEIEKMTFFAPGLGRYIQHKRQWHSHAGQLRPRHQVND